MAHTLVIRNGLTRDLFVDPAITAEHTLLVSVAQKHFSHGHIVSAGACLRLAAEPHLKRCIVDGRLGFQLDNRGVDLPLALAPEPNDDSDTLTYAIVDESSLAERQS